MGPTDYALMAVGILSLIAGLAWWWLSRVGDTAYDKGWALGVLQGHLQHLGSRIGYTLEDEKEFQSFLNDYTAGVAEGKFPQSPEWKRIIFVHQPRSVPPFLLFRDVVEGEYAKDNKAEEEYALECEKWRKAGVAMWYVLGSIQQANAQNDVKVLLFNFYEKHKRPIDGLALEVGYRDGAAGKRSKK